MSRSMEIIEAQGLASNAYQDLLTCPAGHKLEVLQLIVFSNAPGGTQGLLYRRDAAAQLRLYWWLNPPAQARFYTYTMPGLVLYPTESATHYQVAALGTTTYQIQLVYIDVDYAN